MKTIKRKPDTREELYERASNSKAFFYFVAGFVIGGFVARFLP